MWTSNRLKPPQSQISSLPLTRRHSFLPLQVLIPEFLIREADGTDLVRVFDPFGQFHEGNVPQERLRVPVLVKYKLLSLRIGKTKLYKNKLVATGVSLTWMSISFPLNSFRSVPPGFNQKLCELFEVRELRRRRMSRDYPNRCSRPPPPSGNAGKRSFNLFPAT